MMSDSNFSYDLERMRLAVESPTFTMPDGLSREETMEYIIKAANGEIEPDEVTSGKANVLPTK